jgi:hypothetical protein
MNRLLADFELPFLPTVVVVFGLLFATVVTIEIARTDPNLAEYQTSIR